MIHQKQSNPSSDSLDAVDTTAVRDVLQRMGYDAPTEDVASQLAHAGMTVAPQEIDRIKAQLAGGAASQAAPSLEPSTDWSVHEQTSEPANVQAQKLVEQTGSPELAKQAIDTVVDRQQSKPNAPARGDGKKDTFSKHLGFESYLELFESSTPIPSPDGKRWCVTSDRSGQWVAWNDQDLEVQQRFSSREEAVASVAADRP